MLSTVSLLVSFLVTLLVGDVATVSVVAVGTSSMGGRGAR